MSVGPALVAAASVGPAPVAAASVVTASVAAIAAAPVVAALVVAEVKVEAKEFAPGDSIKPRRPPSFGVKGSFTGFGLDCLPTLSSYQLLLSLYVAYTNTIYFIARSFTTIIKSSQLVVI